MDSLVEEGEIISEDEDHDLYHGDPSLSQLILTEQNKKGKTPVL